MTEPTDEWVHGMRAGAVGLRAAAAHFRKAGELGLAQQSKDLADVAATLLRGEDITRDITVPKVP